MRAHIAARWGVMAFETAEALLALPDDRQRTAIRAALVRQAAGPVRWVETVQALEARAEAADLFII